jgi:hypothetical protein
MPRLIVVTKVTGQLGNRLQLHAHLMAAALEHGGLLVNPCLAAYARYFSGTVGNAWGRHDRPVARPAAWWATRVLAQASAGLAWQVGKPGVMRCLGIHAVRARNEEFVDLAGVFAGLAGRRWWLLLTRGLHFYDPAWVGRHAQAIRAFFTPLEPWRGHAETRARLARGDADLLVGVHIRHGDYAQHHGGRWFYPLATYARLMAGVAERLAPRRVRFLVCGNARCEPGDFPGLDATLATGELVEDLHALSCCDLIMGPPSSFSGWAAFWGGRKLHFIDDPALIPGEDDFRPALAPEGGALGADRSGGEAARRRVRPAGG